MRGEQAIFNLEIKKKSGLSINPDIHHSKVFSSVFLNLETKSKQRMNFKNKNWAFKNFYNLLCKVIQNLIVDVILFDLPF